MKTVESSAVFQPGRKRSREDNRKQDQTRTCAQSGVKIEHCSRCPINIGGIVLRGPMLGRKRPTNPALAVHCRAWEVCSVIGELVRMYDDGYGFGWPGAPAAMDDL
jgi:hypothetical protein